MVLGLQDADLVVVGSGFYGLTVAERAAARRRAGRRARAPRAPRRQRLERARAVDRHRGAHLRLAHLPHEQRAGLGYVTRFGAFNDYRHHVWTVHRGPGLPDADRPGDDDAVLRPARSPRRRRATLVAEQAGELGGARPANLEEKAVSLIGRPLYEAFIRGYTAKQWQTDPRELPERIITRLPVRFTYGTRYFTDTYEGIPVDGYGALLTRMAAHARASRCTPASTGSTSAAPSRPGTPVVYTGPVDRCFDDRAGPLSWRTLDLETEVLEVDDHQGTTVMNYADEDVPHTRVHEFQHYHPERPNVDGPDGRHDGALPLGAAGRRAVLPGRHPRGPAPAAGLPRAGGARARRPLRRPAGQLPVPRHAHGDRLGADRVRQRDRPGAAAGPRGDAGPPARAAVPTPIARRAGSAWGVAQGWLRPHSRSRRGSDRVGAARVSRRRPGSAPDGVRPITTSRSSRASEPHPAAPHDRRVHPQLRPEQAGAAGGGRGRHPRHGGRIDPAVQERPAEDLRVGAVDRRDGARRRAAAAVRLAGRRRRGLTAFGAGLVNLYLKTPGLTEEGSIRPTQDGIGIAKDVWLVGVGTTLLVDGLVDGARGAARNARKSARKSAKKARKNARSLTSS